MSRANSLVVGPIYIPCSFNGTYRFSTSTCYYRDSDGWHTWAQQYLANALAVDLSRFRHRVLVLPRCALRGDGAAGAYFYKTPFCILLEAC